MDEAGEPGPGDGLGDLLGIEAFELVGESGAKARLPVSDRVRQPLGIVHGGAYAALAETLTSRATWELLADRGLGAFGQSNLMSFLRPVSAGAIHAAGRAVHRGRTSWVWEVEMSDDEARVAAISRVTIAVRPLEPPDQPR